MATYIAARLWRLAPLVKQKRHILLYTVPVLCLEFYSGVFMSLLLKKAAITAQATAHLLVVPLVFWQFVRVVLLYVCYMRETAFWRRSHRGGTTAALASGTLGSFYGPTPQTSGTI